jgi:hypothetical protein
VARPSLRPLPTDDPEAADAGADEGDDRPDDIDPSTTTSKDDLAEADTAVPVQDKLPVVR